MTSTLNTESVSFLVRKRKEGDEGRGCIIKYIKPRDDLSTTIYIQLGPVWKSQSKELEA